MTQPGYEGAGRLVVPAGLIDKPYEQRRDPLWLDFGGAAGHMQIVGGPQSGKSTLVRSIIASFALTHTPWEVQFYGLDFGGGGMAAVAGLPHVGGVASPAGPGEGPAYGGRGVRRDDPARGVLPLGGHLLHRGVPRLARAGTSR